MMNGIRKNLLSLAVVASISMLGACVASSSEDDATSAAAARAAAANASPGKGTKKVTICHIPPGNPANMHTITVGEPAVRAHLAHGDSLGTCKCECGGGDTITLDETNPPAIDSSHLSGTN